MSHEHWLESAAAYALDSLDPAERPIFEAHLSGCADCRLALHEFREVAGLLVHASTPEAAPAGLRARVAGLVRADARRASVQPRRSRSATLPWLAAAAAVVAALGAGEWARRASSRVDALAERVSGLDAALAVRDTVLRLLTGPEVHVVSLAAAGEKPAARVFWNHVEQRFVVTAFDLPPAAPGHTYQLWAIARDKPPVSMGTFDTAPDGAATAVLPVGPEIEALGFIELCALTEEPAGGSPGPTETPRLSGEWIHAD